jgi:curved DNA-binding protein CbpA
VRPEDAFAELGVALGAPAEAIRRAYLKLVRQRSPEADPEGFQRAREAYEVARAFSKIGLVVAGARGARREPAEPAPVEAEERESAEQPEEELRPVTARPEPRADIYALLQRRAFRDVAPLLLADLEAATREGRPPRAPPAHQVRVILELVRDHAPGSAARLYRRFARWVDVAGGEATVVAGAGPAWIVTKELIALGKSVPLGLRAAMAGGALGDPPATTSAALTRFEDDDPIVAGRVARLLRRDAPLLASLWATSLDSSQRASAPQPRRRLPAGAWILGVFLLSNALRALGSCVESERPPAIRDAAPLHEGHP